MDNNELTKTLKSIFEKLEDMSHKINLMDEKLEDIHDDTDKRFDGIHNEIANVCSVIDERSDAVEDYICDKCDEIEKKLEDLEYNIPG